MTLTTVNPALLDTQAQYTGFKNRIINGAMVIDQRNAGASVTQTTSVSLFSVDRWQIYGTVTSKFTAQQNAGAVTPPAGYSNYLGFTSLSAFSTSAGDQFITSQNIEGFNAADLGWGSANAQAITISFWVRSSLTGSFGGAVANSAFNRSYPFGFTISVANTWEQKTVTIAGDTSGTWLTNTSIGIRMYFNLGSGSTYLGTANTWAGSLYVAPTGAVSVVGTSGATFYITGVQLEKGSTATSFDYRPYGTELGLCQRYLPAIAVTTGSHAGQAYAATDAKVSFPFSVQARVAPTGVTVLGGTVQVVLANFSGQTGSANAYYSGSVSGGSISVSGGSGLVAGNACLSTVTAAATILWTGCEL